MTINQQIQKIRSFKIIKGVNVPKGDTKVVLTTMPLYFRSKRCKKKHLLGRYKILIDYESGKLRIINLDYVFDDCFHPNVTNLNYYEDQDICLGGYVWDCFNRMILDKNLLGATILLLSFLQEPDYKYPYITIAESEKHRRKITYPKYKNVLDYFKTGSYIYAKK